MDIARRTLPEVDRVRHLQEAGTTGVHRTVERRVGQSRKSQVGRYGDLFLAGAGLALTTVAVLAWATRMEVQATRETARLTEWKAREVAGRAALTELQRRAGEGIALRQAVARRLEDLRARCLAQPSATLSEASRVRPKGVWLTRLCWAGEDLKVEGRTWGGGPATEFAGRLARSPHFAQVFTVPAGDGQAGGATGPERFLLFARAIRKL